MEKISGYQLSLMGGLIVSVITLVNVPSQVIMHAKQHVYIPYILAAASILIFLWLISKVSIRFPDQDLLQVLTDKMPVIGKLILSLYILFFFLILARDIRILTDFVNIFLLQDTPLIVITTLFVIPVIFMVRGGIEVLARMTELFMPITIVVILSIPILLIKDINPTFFLPITDIQWKGIGVGWWYLIAYMGEIMLLPFLFSNQTFKFKYGLFGLMIGTGILLIISIFQLFVLGIHITPRMTFPTYSLIRQINVTDFLDRFEVIMVALYFPSTMLKMSYTLFLICRGYNKIVPKIPPKMLVAPVGLLAMVLAHWFYEDLLQIIDLNAIWPAFALVFEFFFPLLLFFFLYPKKKQLNSTTFD